MNVEPSEDVPAHRRASRENLRRVADADFVVVTANPDAEVGVEEMLSAVALVRETLPGAPVFAGKMHGSGGRGMVGEGEISRLAETSDAVLIAAPGTVPGSQEPLVAALADAAHASGALVVATVGTSQEGADAETVRELALAAKRAGADVLHLGDAGVSGITDPMNVLAASIAIRGRRHAYRRMAMMSKPASRLAARLPSVGLSARSSLRLPLLSTLRLRLRFQHAAFQAACQHFSVLLRGL